jgi:tetratricopeptide (TPR) repeat protein
VANISNDTNNVITNNINNGVVNNVNVNNQPWVDYNDHYHDHWHGGYWNFSYRPIQWVAGYSSSSVGWATGFSETYVYSNPYYVQSTTQVLPAYDYSQPITVASASTSGSNSELAIRYSDAARAFFRAGEYGDAQEQVESAQRLMPNDRTLHEFRALVLFARGDYADAAAAMYAVLAAGPGWNWDTIGSLYPDTETYTTQVQALTNYVNNHPDRADARFLLAYHYTSLGYGPEAVAEFERIIELQPKDRVSAQLLLALKQPAQLPDRP